MDSPFKFSGFARSPSARANAPPCYTPPRMASVHKCDAYKKTIRGEPITVATRGLFDRSELCKKCAAPILGVLCGLPTSTGPSRGALSDRRRDLPVSTCSARSARSLWPSLSYSGVRLSRPSLAMRLNKPASARRLLRWMGPEMAHFAHSLGCGDRVRLQDYFCRAGEAPARRTIVESPGGLSPPGAPKTVHDRLESHGSRCSAVAMA